MAIFRCDQEHMPLMIPGGIIIDALRTCTRKDVHQLKEVMGMCRLAAYFLRFYKFNRKWLMQIFPFHGTNIPNYGKYLPVNIRITGINLLYKQKQ
jgi:hypothetical protein